MRYTRIIANMFDDRYRTEQLACYIVCTQNDSTSPMKSSMHPKQLNITHETRIVENMFELMIGIAFTSRLATLFVLTVTRRRA